jgi:hypothetical protein
MDLVNFKNNVNTHVLVQDIKTQLLTKLGNIPNILLLKNDIELTLYVCNCVENMIAKGSKLDKKSLVVDVLGCVFQLTDEEKTAVKNTIDFLFSNKKIKIASAYKQYFKMISEWITRKFL